MPLIFFVIWYKLSFELIGEPPQLVQIYIEPQHKLVCHAPSIWSVEAQLTWELKDDDGVSNVSISPKNTTEKVDKVWKLSRENSLFEENSNEEKNNETFENQKNTKKSRLKSQIISNKHAEEDTEIEKGFLEKLWGATKKGIQKIFPPIPEKKSNINPKEEINADEELAEEHTENSLFDAENTIQEIENTLQEGEEVKEIIEKKEEKFQFSNQITHFYNPDQYIRTIVCGSEKNGQILCVDLAEMAEYKVFCRYDAFVIGRFGTKIQYFWQNEMQKIAFLEIKGDDYIFLRSEGFLKEYYLEDDAIILPANRLLAFQSGLVFSEFSQKNFINPHQNPNMTNILVKLQGRGKYWLG